MDKDKMLIDSLRRSLWISVVANVVLVLAMFAATLLNVFDAWPTWDAGAWFKRDKPPSSFAGREGLQPDSLTLAISRELSPWAPPGIDAVPDDESGARIRYGRELIANTAVYLGPKGKIASITNGLNCQNCHLEAGAKQWGNNYGAVAATYPKYRARSGTEEDIYKRVNDCLERSLNGQALPLESPELQAMAAYINWVGHEVPKKESPVGSGIFRLPFLDRAADPERGKVVYDAKCASCHGADGQGALLTEGNAYAYPPLWGPHSYNHGAGLFRLSMFAGYVKYNMPLGVRWPDSQLSDAECWDVAAFVNSQPRPGKDLSADWPDIGRKPVDHPFGPYADAFSEKQHKYGPFGPIEAAKKAQASAQKAQQTVSNSK